MEFPARKRIRLEYGDYTIGGYFVTICTANRESMFWAQKECLNNVPVLSPLGKLVEETVLAIPEHYPNVQVDKYCVMPNHVHILLILQKNGEVSLSRVIGQMKRQVSRQAGKAVWQKSYYDHGIRNDADYREIWQYIDNNPVKWQLDKLYKDG